MTSANNKDMIQLIKDIGDTPGFRLADAKSGNFAAVRLSMIYKHTEVPEAKKTLSIRTKNSAYQDVLTDIKNKLGWTPELHADLKDIVRNHRLAETDPTQAITDRLLTAFAPGWDTPVPEPVEETDEQRRERVRHDRLRTVAGGSVKDKSGQAMTGTSIAPVQVLADKGAIRAEHISPERALDLLVTIADYQRKLKPDKVKEFMRKMDAGEWDLLASDPICVDWNGKLCNGQHRLEAVYQLERGQDFYVAYDVDPATYDKMDRGTRRTTADMLYGKANLDGTARKDVSSTALSSLLRIIHLWENFPQLEWSAQHRHIQEPQVMDALERHPEAVESVAHGHLRKIKIRPTASMFAHFMIAHRHGFEDDAVKVLNGWFEELRSPRHIRPGDPAFALREWFLGGEMDRVANRKTLPGRFEEQMLQTYLILRAWDNTTQGKEMRRLSWKPDFTIATAARITDRTSYPPSH